MLQKRESIFSSIVAAASHMKKGNHYINCSTAGIKHGYNYYSITAEFCSNRLVNQLKKDNDLFS